MTALHHKSLLLRVTMFVLAIFLFSGCSKPESVDQAEADIVKPEVKVTKVEAPEIASNGVKVASAERGNNPNIILMIGDDMGNDTLSCYGLNDDTAKTPHLDKLCKEGVRFDNFWSQPICSPTRATLISGRYGFRTGVGRPTGDNDSMGEFPTPPPKPESAPFEPPRGMGGMGGMGGGMGMTAANGEPLPADFGLLKDELTLPMVFKDNADRGYTTAAIGKWHLADPRNGWENHPNLVGFDHFSGLIRGFPDSYFTWNKVVNGKWSGETGYAPTDKTNDAIAWLDQHSDQSKFLWFAFTLPHTPIHKPPAEFVNSDISALDPTVDPRDNIMPYYKAMIETMDTQIGRLLDSMSPSERDNTYVIFMGDNGTGGGPDSSPFPQGRAKGSIYQGGVSVPLIITGPGIEPGVSKMLVNSVDIFSTIIDMAGLDMRKTIPDTVTIDAVSILPHLKDPAEASSRDFVYADVFRGNFAGVPDANYAMSNGTYKVMRHNGNVEFYHLASDPYEQNNLLEGDLSADEQVEFDQLSEKVAALRASK